MTSKSNSKPSESATSNDKIRTIFAKFSQLDSSFPQSLKNPKVDVTQPFFTLIDHLSDFFNISSLPAQQNRLFYSSFLLLHRYAINLYTPHLAFNESEFTAEWRHFSSVFKMFESSLFPYDFSSSIDQIRLYLLPLKPRIESSDELMTKLNSFVSKFSQIQDSLGTIDEYNRAISDFSKLKQLIENQVYFAKQAAPHLINSLNMTHFILAYGQKFFRLREIIKVINLKLKNSEVMSIQLPSTTNEHRRFLLNTFRIFQSENKFLLDSINDTNYTNDLEKTYQKLGKFGRDTFYLTSAYLSHLFSSIALNLDKELLPAWEKYLKQIGEMPPFPSKDGKSSSESLFRIHHTPEKEILNHFEQVISQQHIADHRIILLYEEFNRLYVTRIENDTTFRSFPVITHCYHLLFSIIHETHISTVEEAAKEVMECLILRLLISKIDYDTHHIQPIIECINSKSELDNKTTNQRFLDSLKVLQEAARRINVEFNDIVALDYLPHRLFLNYSHYLALIVSFLDSKETTEADFELVRTQYLAYHLDPRLLAKSLSYFFQRALRRYITSYPIAPPITLFSLDSDEVTSTELREISNIFLTEELRTIDSQYILAQYINLSIFLKEVATFLEAYYPDGLNESNEVLSDQENKDFYILFVNLIKYTKLISDKTQQYHLSRVLVPFYISITYNSVSNQIPHILNVIYQNLSVPDCSNMLIDLFNKIYTCQCITKKIDAINPFLKVLKKLITHIFAGKFMSIDELSIDTDIKAKAELIVIEVRKLNLDQYIIDDILSIPVLLDKILYSNTVLARIESQFQALHFDSNFNQQRGINSHDTGYFFDLNSKKSEKHQHEKLQRNSKKGESDSYFESVFFKVNYLGLVRRYLQEAINENLIIDDDDCFEPVGSFIKTIDQNLEEKHFLKLNIQQLDLINAAFKPVFNSTVVANNLLGYFEKWAVWSLNINFLTSNGDLITIEFLKEIKKIISELSDDPSRYLSLTFVISQLEKLSKSAQSLDKIMLNSICNKLIKKIRIVKNLEILKNYSELNCQYSSTPPNFLADNFEINMTKENDQLHHIKQSMAYIIELTKSLQPNNYLKDIYDQITEMYNKDFHKHCKTILSATPESINKMESSHFKSLRRALKCRINTCKLLPCKQIEYPSFDEPFERFLNLLQSLSRQKEEKIRQLREKVAEFEAELRKLEQDLKDENNPNTVKVQSALEQILNDEVIENLQHSTISINENPVINSLLEKVKESEILNYRLHQKLDQFHLPTGTPIPSDKIIDAYSLDLNSFEGTSWMLNTVKENSEMKKQLEKLEKERFELFMQTAKANREYNAPLQQQVIDNYYTALLNASKNALQNNPPNGKVSKSTFLNYVEKSDAFFTYIDYDIRAMKRRLDEITNPNHLLPKAFIDQFNRKLRS